MHAIFTTSRILVSIVFLTYASWSDYRTREVSNRVWMLYGPLALVLSLIDFILYEPSRLPFFGFSFGVTAVVAIILFYSGGFGGADSKALMCIALALPFSTKTVFQPLIPSGVSPLSVILFPIVIFSNGVLLAAATGLYLLFYNFYWHKKFRRKIFEDTLASESIGKRLLAMITGRRTHVSELKEKWHFYPMEDVEEDTRGLTKRSLVVIPRDEGRDEIVEHLSTAVESGKINAYVWTTPGLPMLIFITLGFVVSLLFGDLVWIVLSSFLG